MTAPLLSVRGIGKRYGNVRALADVDLDFQAGTIHALLGENGAGKSTLMHVLAGVVRPDRGTILLEGAPVTFDSPRAARRAGIGMVHQHFTLIDALTVAENLAVSLAPPGRLHWRFDTAQVGMQARVLAERIGLGLPAAETRVCELPVGVRQRLEIVKALAGTEAGTSRVLILDEPTAVLTPQEVQQLFGMIRELRAQGQLVLFITHKLHEVTAVADAVTIMRRGRVVTTESIGGLAESEMAERMLGTVAPVRRRTAPPSAQATTVLRVSQLSAVDSRGVPVLTDVSLAVRAGEVLGIAGVDGNGQRELFDVLVGLRRPTRGSVSVVDQVISEFTPAATLAAGIGHIPPDRQHDGLVLPMTVEENLLLGRNILDRFSHRGVLRRAAARNFAQELARAYAVRAASLEAPVRSLSGGNQQRVVVARELALQPQVLVAVNPTRGLDLAGAATVTDALVDAAGRGCAVVLISTDLDEVLDLSDRVAVLFRGRLSAALEPPVDIARLGLLMAGAG